MTVTGVTDERDAEILKPRVQRDDVFDFRPLLRPTPYLRRTQMTQNSTPAARATGRSLGGTAAAVPLSALPPAARQLYSPWLVYLLIDPTLRPHMYASAPADYVTSRDGTETEPERTESTT